MLDRDKDAEVEASLRRILELVGVGYPDIIVANTMLGRIRRETYNALGETDPTP